MKTMSLIFFVPFFSAFIFGQAAYLEPDQRGYAVSAGFASNEYATGFFGSFGFSPSGRFDFAFSVGSVNYEGSLFGSSLSAISLSPSVTIYPIKQSDDNPVSLAIGASYEWQSYSHDMLTRANVDMNGRVLSLGAGLLAYFWISNSVRIIPSVSAAYLMGEISLTNEYGSQYSDSDNATAIGIEMSFVFGTSFQNNFAVSPMISISEGTTSAGVKAAYIFSAN